MHGLMRGSEELDRGETLWHWRDTSQLTENTNVNLSRANLTLLYRRNVPRKAQDSSQTNASVGHIRAQRGSPSHRSHLITRSPMGS